MRLYVQVSPETCDGLWAAGTRSGEACFTEGCIATTLCHEGGCATRVPQKTLQCSKEAKTCTPTRITYIGKAPHLYLVSAHCGRYVRQINTASSTCIKTLACCARPQRLQSNGGEMGGLSGSRPS